MPRTLPDGIIGQDAEKGKDLVPPLQLAQQDVTNITKKYNCAASVTNVL